MNSHQNTITNRSFVESRYAVQRELGGRLNLLNGFIGNPHGHSSHAYDRDVIEAARREGMRRRSGVFASTAKAMVHGVAGVVRRYREWRVERENMLELRSLSDRTLRDIGVSRGDIAAIASGVLTANGLNETRAEIAKPRLRVVQGGRTVHGSKQDAHSEIPNAA